MKPAVAGQNRELENQMKTLLFYFALSMTMFVQGQTFAQQSGSAEPVSDQQTIADKSDIRIKFDIGDEEEVASPEQKIERAVETIRKLAGDEVGDKLALELDGLTQEEKKELVAEFSNSLSFSGIGGGEAAVAIVAIVFSLGMPIIILLMVLIFAHRKRRQKMDVVKAYLDSDREAPAQVLAEFTGEDTNNFRSGVKLVAIGLGVILALYFSGNGEAAAFGLIPLFIGGARLLFWKYDNRVDEA